MLIALIVVVALVGLRLALPSIIVRYANAKLSHLDGYRGHIEHVTLSLWRGAGSIHGVKLEKVRGSDPVPFFTADAVDLSIEWSAALRGSLVGEVILERPKVNLEPDAASAEKVEKLDRSISAIAAMGPLNINRLAVQEGELHYRDRHSTPPIDIRLSNIFAAAENLRNVRGTDKRLPASVGARATAFETGTLTLVMDFDPMVASPTFLLKSTLQGVKLVALNDLLEAYAKFRVKSGDLGLYVEVAANDGAYIGYVKPIIKNLEIEKKETRTFLKKLWSHVVAVAGAVLTNPRADQVATKVPLEGKFGDGDADLWVAVGGLLKNAFIRALTPSLDYSVRFVDVKK